jgi:hypothetical protein
MKIWRFTWARGASEAYSGPQLLDCRAQILIFATEIVMYGFTLRIDQYGERQPLGS